jgi:DNA-binding XRE family transcriptional regulator
MGACQFHAALLVRWALHVRGRAVTRGVQAGSRRGPYLPEKISAEVRAARIARDFTQRELASVAGVSERSVIRLEVHGRAGASVADAVCCALGLGQ